MAATSPLWSRRSDGEPGRRRLLDGRHGRHPADAARAEPTWYDRRSCTRRSGCPSGSHDSVRANGRLYAQALAAASALVPYSGTRSEVLAGWLGERRSDVRVEFVPFGVDDEAFRATDRGTVVDVISIGADPHRDFELLLTVARSLAETRFLVVTTAERLRSFDGLPGNVSVEPSCRSTRCVGGSSAREPSRCPCARTATRARRQSFSRRWRSGSRSSSRGRRRSPRATG